MYTGPVRKEQWEVEKAIMESIPEPKFRTRFTKLNRKQRLARAIHKKLSDEGILKYPFNQ